MTRRAAMGFDRDLHHELGARLFRDAPGPAALHGDPRPQGAQAFRRIGTTWCVIALFAAVLIGVIGRAMYPSALLTSVDSESVFILLATNLMPALVAGIVMARILAATISSSDSYLLIAASAFSKTFIRAW